MTLPRLQFRLDQRRVTVPEGWITEPAGGRLLSRSPDLPATRLTVGGQHREQGWLVGWTPLGLSGGTLPDVLALDQLHELGGRWVFVGDRHLRLDPLGSYSVVYDPDSGTVASSTAVLAPGELTPDDDLIGAMGLPQVDRWYPFGLTPYRNVRRLLPNQTLDLGGMVAAVHRTAPVAGDEANIRTIAGNLVAQLRMLAGPGLLMGLTGGNESRMLLAALRDVVDRTEFFTISAGTPGPDVLVAGQLAARFGLSHQVRPRVRDRDAEAEWFEAVGRCVAGATMRNAAVKRTLPADRVLIKGMAGEIARARYRTAGGTSAAALDVPSVLQRLKLPQHPACVSACETWLDSVREESRLDQVDLLYAENRVGCWAAPAIHGDIGPLANIWPLNQASTIAAMRGLSPEVKRSETVARLVAELLWPELLTVPISSSSARTGLRARAGRALRRIGVP